MERTFLPMVFYLHLYLTGNHKLVSIRISKEGVVAYTIHRYMFQYSSGRLI